jgi:hypothetical protein
MFKPINMLWTDGPLSRLERLAMRSFIENKHDLRVWSYESLDLPAGAQLMDAAEIMPRETLRYSSDYMNFSARFRFKLLFERGGCWVDTDVICIHPFDMADEMYAWSDDHTIEIAVLCLPKGSKRASDMLEWVSAHRTRLGIEKFTEYADKSLALCPVSFYPIRPHDWRSFFRHSPPIDGCYAVHCWNHLIKQSRYDKNARYPQESLFEQLCSRYGV